MFLLYAFPNRSSDCDEIWYIDRLDFEEDDRLHFKYEVQPGEVLKQGFWDLR